MVGYIFSKYDIGILRQDATNTIGMMLVQGKYGVPRYNVYDDEYLASQFFTGTPGYGSLPAEKEIAIRQDDWRAGFGLQYYDAADPKRYFSSIGMDMRFRGMGIAGPTPTAIPIPPTGPAKMENVNFEAATHWTGGAINSVIYHGDAASWRVWGSAADQNVAGFSTNWCGYYHTVNCYVHRTGSSDGWVGIDDGVTLTNSAKHSGGGAWELLSVGKTLATNATRLQVKLFADGISFFDDLDLRASAANLGNPVAFADFNDKLYIGSGRDLYKLNSTGDALTRIYCFPENITALEPFTDNKMYVAQNTAANYYSMNTAEGFAAIGTIVNCQFMKTVFTASPTMYANDSNWQLRSNTTPSNALSWSTVTNVGSSFHNITDLKSFTGALYILKEDKPYYLDSVGAVQDDLAPELETEQASTSGKNATSWQNKLYIPCGDQTLLEHDDGTNTYLNPSDYCTELAHFVGRVQALAHDHRYLFAIVYYSGSLEILAGRWETVDGTTRWVWHPFTEIAGLIGDCDVATVSTVYQKRLWIGSHWLTTNRLHYIPLPTGYGNITSDPNNAFISGGYMHTPWLHGNFKGDDKAFIKLISTLGHPYNADVYFETHYRTLENSSWTLIGDAKGTTASMVNTQYIPLAGTTNPVSTMLQLNYCVNTAYTDKTPVLLGYDLRAILQPPRRSIIACTVRAAKEIALKDGTIDKGSQPIIIETLDESRIATWPVTFKDIDGSSLSVKFLPLPSGTPRWTLAKDEKGRNQERHYNLLLQCVDLG